MIAIAPGRGPKMRQEVLAERSQRRACRRAGEIRAVVTQPHSNAAWSRPSAPVVLTKRTNSFFSGEISPSQRARRLAEQSHRGNEPADGLGCGRRLPSFCRNELILFSRAKSAPYGGRRALEKQSPCGACGR